MGIAHIATTFPDPRDLRWLQIHAWLKRRIMHNKKNNKNAPSAKNSKTSSVNNGGGVRAVWGRPRKNPRLQGCQKHVLERWWASVAYYYSNKEDLAASISCCSAREPEDRQSCSSRQSPPGFTNEGLSDLHTSPAVTHTQEACRSHSEWQAAGRDP